MIRYIKHIFVVVGLQVLTMTAFAVVKLPSFFGDNMVLQQKSTVPIWGRGYASSVITLVTSWNHKTYTCRTDASGTWRTKITTPAAGGPYSISIADDKPIVIQNILIGEVWFCSGQSNMEMPMRGFKNQPVLSSNELLLEASNDQLRLFDVKRAAAKIPLDTVSGQWKVSDPEAAKEFSAVAFLYGMMLQQKLKVPVGIIVSCWGGTRIQSWMDAETLAAFPDDLNEYFLKADSAKELHKVPTALFNGMIAPFAGLGIRGFLWYQGESNRHEPAKYASLFPAMVKAWRNSWDDHKDSLPFYYVQIAPYGNKDTTRSVKGIREAQLKSLSVIPNSGMAVTMDIGDSSYIHPRVKKTVSQRLLLWALTSTYGWKGLSYSGPLYKSMSIKDSMATLSFDYAENGLSTFGQPFSHLEMAGADKVFYPAEGKITDKGTLMVWSAKVPHPVAVRYAWLDYVKGELFNTAGLPASSFRTDDW